MQILDYWLQKTGNKKYSDYLNDSFIDIIDVISEFPQVGRIYKETEYRFMVKDNYLLFYEWNKDVISILAIFDSRRNPDKLDEKLKN